MNMKCRPRHQDGQRCPTKDDVLCQPPWPAKPLGKTLKSCRHRRNAAALNDVQKDRLQHLAKHSLSQAKHVEETQWWRWSPFWFTRKCYFGFVGNRVRFMKWNMDPPIKYGLDVYAMGAALLSGDLPFFWEPFAFPYHSVPRSKDAPVILGFAGFFRYDWQLILQNFSRSFNVHRGQSWGAVHFQVGAYFNSAAIPLHLYMYVEVVINWLIHISYSDTIFIHRTSFAE